MNNLLKNKFSNHQAIEFIFIFTLLVFPKIDIIKIPNYYQGIRIEDLIIVYIGLSLYFSNSLKIKKNDFGYLFYFFFFVILISMLHGSLYFAQKWISIPRYIEYIIILIYFNRNNPNVGTIFLIFRLYLIFNFIFVIFQKFELVGEFSSLGYLDPENLPDSRPNGLTGGPWELSNCSAIIFFALLLDKKQSNFLKYFYSILAIFLILITESRTILVAFSLASFIYFYIQNISKTKYLLVIPFLTCVLLIFYFYDFNFFKSGKVYLELLGMFKNFVYYLEKPNYEILDGRLWSIALRIHHWVIFYEQFLHNTLTMITGAGFTSLYYESTIFRILFGTGIYGLIFTIYGARKIPLHILTLIFVSGLSLDLLLSFKIFITILLYCYIKNKHDYRY